MYHAKTLLLNIFFGGKNKTTEIMLTQLMHNYINSSPDYLFIYNTVLSNKLLSI